MSTPRVLFILKRRHQGPYGAWNHSPDGKPLPSGLSISASQMALALDELGIPNKLVQVIDNNCIDREVTQYRPTHVIIEAFWVVPEKFDILRKLHPNVKWVVRNHSKSDFLSHEGGMVGWAIDYVKRGVTLACNSPEATADFKRLAVSVGADPTHVIYLPNYYRAGDPPGFLGWLKIKFFKVLRWLGFVGPKRPEPEFLRIGCFGAIRPLKNHLHQAMAAIEMASAMGFRLKFYVNGNRVEGKAEPILTSLRQLFNRYPMHELVELGWMEHDEFQSVLQTMHLVMQVSNSETFNIVAADSVLNGTPVLVSDEIPWLDGEYHANPNSVKHIAVRLSNLWCASGSGRVQQDQLAQLQEYGAESKRLWAHYLLHKEHHLHVPV